MSGIFVPPAIATDSLLEAVEAGIQVAVIIADGVPVQDMVRTKRYLAGRSTTIIGPNSPGIITPGECKVGIMPSHIYAPGRVGVVSRSGTLNYEAVSQMTALGLGPVDAASASAATRSTAPTSRRCCRPSRTTTTPTWS